MKPSPARPRPVPVRRYRYSKWRWRILVHVLDAAGAWMMWLWRRFRPRVRIDSPQRILIIQLDHLGDAVLSSPLFPILRAAYPHATIDVLASPSNREVFEADPHIDHVHVADRNWFERRPGRWALGSAVWKLGRLLRAQGYDLGIDVRGDVLSVLVLALAGIPRRVGWAMGGGGFLLTDVAVWNPNRHEVEARLALLAALGISWDRPTPVIVHATDEDRLRVARWLLEAWPAREDHRARRELSVKVHAYLSAPEPMGAEESDEEHENWLDATTPLLAVHLGAGMASKRWPPQHWSGLVNRFLTDGWRVIVIGGREDGEAAHALDPDPNLRDWTGRLSVLETAALLERADLFIGADSGPAHLAACAGLPSIILFSGTNQMRQWRPWSRRSLIMRHRVPCQPCHQKVCPLADHPCMTGLDPERVYRAARRWWARMQRSERTHATASR
jgi:ADP-heptose:LPS heptosyltransferase